MKLALLVFGVGRLGLLAWGIARWLNQQDQFVSRATLRNYDKLEFHKGVHTDRAPWDWSKVNW